MEATITKTVVTSATPAELASLFWAMNSEQQADFFVELAKQTRATHLERLATPPEKRGLWFTDEFGDGQWWHLGQDIAKHEDAKNVLRAMASPLYLAILTRGEMGVQ